MKTITHPLHSDSSTENGFSPFPSRTSDRNVAFNGINPTRKDSAIDSPVQEVVAPSNGALVNGLTGTACESDVTSRIDRTIHYMKQHMNEPLRAATLARIANMSLPHYFALFKRLVGSSPIDYFIHVRMQQARRLLAETSWRVKEVASFLGYEDPLYFSRAFKLVNHVTPTDYRASVRRQASRKETV